MELGLTEILYRQQNIVSSTSSNQRLSQSLICDRILGNQAKSNISKIKLTPPAYCHTTALLNFKPKLWSTYSRLILPGVKIHDEVKDSNGGFWHWWVSGLAISSSFAVQMFKVLILIYFSHWGASTAHPGWFLGFTHAVPLFCTLKLAHHSIFANEKLRLTLTLLMLDHSWNMLLLYGLHTPIVI